MIISLSTGTIYKWGKNINELITICRDNTKVNGIELMFANKKNLETTKISAKNLEWLKTLPHVTLHAPVKIIEESINENDIENQLKILQNIYNLTKAKAIIFHVTNLPKLKTLNKFNFKFIIENTTIKGNINLVEFNKIIDNYDCDICLDVSHAFTWSDKEAQKYWQKLSSHIFQIHLSSSRGNHEHLPMSNLGIDYKKSIEFLGLIDKPFVIESDYNDKNINFLNKDLNFINNYFKK